jgi:hypothetical protein
MARTRLAVVVALAMILAAPGAHAQNLIPNSSFSSLFMLEGWPVSDGGAWSAIDSDEVPNSGSVRVVNSVASIAKGVVSVCLPTEAMTQYRVGALALWLDAESSATGNVHLRVEFYPNGTCQSGGSFADGTGLVPIGSDVWQRVQTVVTSPAGSTSATVDLWTWKDPGAGNFIAYFDEVELVALPEPNASVLALAALMGLVACSRLRPGRGRDARKQLSDFDRRAG